MQYIINEFICNTANILLRYRFQDSDILDFSNKESIKLLKIKNSDTREFALALPIDILVNPDTRGKAFYYIDNFIMLGVFSNQQKRLAYVVAIIINVFGVLDNKLIKRKDLLLLKKLKADKSLEEQKIILDQFFMFRALIVSLLDNKLVEQSETLQVFIQDYKVLMKDLDIAIGYNDHTSQNISMGKYFQNRLRYRINRKNNIKTIISFGN